MQFDKVSEELLQQAASAIPKALTSLLKIGSRWANARDLLNHTKEYKARLEADCSQMQILGMEQPISLDHIYTEVRIVNRIQSRMYKTIAELEAEARQAVERRALQAIEAKKRNEIEHAIKKERRQAAAANINENYRTQYERLLADRKDRFLLLYPNCTEPMDPFLSHLTSDYKSRLSELRLATAAEKDLSNLHESEKAALKEQFIDEQARSEMDTRRRGRSILKTEVLSSVEYQRAREELDRKHRATSERLKKEVQRSTAALLKIEEPYRDLVQVFESNFRRLKEEKRQQLRSLQRESQETPLSQEEERRLTEQLSIEVEKELNEATRRELTHRVFADFGHATRRDEQPQPGWEAISTKSRSLVLGQPGAGKTTFLKFVALKHLRGLAPNPKLPIIVALRAFSASGCTDLLDYIALGFSDCGFPDAGSFVRHLLESKDESILLFDGLDEVSHREQEAIVVQIVRLSKRYRHNQFVVSCRTANYRGQLDGFTEFEIAEFGAEQVATFVYGWFRESSQLADDFLIEIKRHGGLLELTTTPLLLALLCIGYRRNQRFPAQKALIYLASLDALLVDWDSSKQLRRESFLESFESESKKELLAKVACDTFCEEALFFSHPEIVALFDQDSTALPIPQGCGDRILREYVENHGLMIERAKGIYSFSHLTLQEFLAALHISRNQPLSVLERLVEEAWRDARWKETVVFVGGLLPRADAYVVCIRNLVKNRIVEAALRQIFVPEELPRHAAEYLDRSKTKGDKNAWTAWFRWRLFEYRLHEASYGTERSGIATQLGNLGISTLIAQALGLPQELGHPLEMDRPLNAAVAGSFASLVTPGVADALRTEGQITTSYLSLVGMLAEILASGVKIEPSLRTRVLLDIAQATCDKWEYPSAVRSNRLGA